MNNYKTLMRMPAQKVEDIALAAGIIQLPLDNMPRHNYKKFLVQKMVSLPSLKDNYGEWIV